MLKCVVCANIQLFPFLAKVNIYVASAAGGLVGIYMWHGWYLQALAWNVRLERRTVQIVQCTLSAFLLFKCTMGQNPVC